MESARRHDRALLTGGAARPAVPGRIKMPLQILRLAGALVQCLARGDWTGRCTMDADSASLMDVILDDPGERPVGIYQIVHRLTDLNAKQAKKLVDSAPQAILRRMTRTQAEAIKIELEGLGAQVRLAPAE